MKLMTIGAASALFFACSLSFGQVQQQLQPAPQPVMTPYPQPANAAQPAAAEKAKPRALNNKMCPVSNEPIARDGGKKVVHKGYEISLCCGGCVKKFNKNPDAYLNALLSPNKSAPAAQAANVKPVNNAACPVSGHPVGSMQKGSHVIYKGYNIGLCCDSCIGRFNQNADAYLQAMLKQ